MIIDGEEIYLEGAIVGTVDAKDDNDDNDDVEEQEEEEATTSKTNKKKNKMSIAVEATSGNAESDDVIVVLASMLGEQVVKREVVRYTVKELDIPENQQQEENTVVKLLSGRKLMERVSK